MKKSERLLRQQATQLVIPTQEDFQLDLAARCREAVQRTMQLVLDEELARLVGAGPYQRSGERVDVRNGTYARRIVTTTGEVGVRVGRTRAGGSATKPLGRYRRRQQQGYDTSTGAYVRGASPRDSWVLISSPCSNANRVTLTAGFCVSVRLTICPC